MNIKFTHPVHIFQKLSFFSTFHISAAKSVLALIIIMVSFDRVAAQLNYTQTADLVSIYIDDSQPVISLPLNKPFINGAIVNQKIKEKLGSYKLRKKKILSKTNEIENLKISQHNESIIISGRLKGHKIESDFSLKFVFDGINLLYNLEIENRQINELIFQFTSTNNEQIFGLGEQFSHVNFKGHKVPMLVEENGIGRGDKRVTGIARLVGAAGHEMATYAPIPFFLTTANRAFLLNNTEYSEFDFTDDSFIKIEAKSNHITGIMWQAKSPKELLTLYTATTGRMPILPDFVYNGAILGLQGGREKVERIIKETLAHGTPVSAIWIQDWVGKRKTAIGSRLQWDWQANEEVYPDFKNWCDSLINEGIKVLGYINPYMVEGGVATQTALQNKYIVHDKNNKPYKFKAGGFKAYMIDMTNPEAYEWYQNIILENMLGQGLSGWMADFGEWLPFDAKLHSGIDAATYHNQYPVEWTKLNREAVEKSGLKEIFIFNRSGFAYSNKYSTTFWVGDQMANFGKNDGLPSAICAFNSSGMSGITINHSDIGGYTAIKLGPFRFLRNKEILFTWMDMESFTPIFRTHEGLLPEKMVQFYTDEETHRYFSETANRYLANKDLFKQLNIEASEKGWPIIRHPYLEFPTDTNTYNLKYQFMLGNSLMIIPKIQENSKDVKGYLPEGNWLDIAENTVYEGGAFHNFPLQKRGIVVLRKQSAK
jgi:sulfoquinovosidase